MTDRTLPRVCPACEERFAMPGASLCSTCYDWPAENPDELQPEPEGGYSDHEDVYPMRGEL